MTETSPNNHLAHVADKGIASLQPKPFPSQTPTRCCEGSEVSHDHRKVKITYKESSSLRSLAAAPVSVAGGERNSLWNNDKGITQYTAEPNLVLCIIHHSSCPNTVEPHFRVPEGFLCEVKYLSTPAFHTMINITKLLPAAKMQNPTKNNQIQRKHSLASLHRITNLHHA